MKKLKSEFRPHFESRDGELVCPEVDLSVARRLAKLPNRGSGTTSRPMDQEKEWVASQQDLLDIVRPLVVIWSQVNEGDLHSDFVDQKVISYSV